MFPQIPQQRLLIYLLALGMLPILFVGAYVYMQYRNIVDLQTETQEMQQMIVIREKKQAANSAVRHHYHEADHFYIDKYLETITFLEPEIENLQKVLSNKTIAENETHKKRLEFLTSPSNVFSFSEGVVQSTPLFQETTETLVHPVEVSAADLKKVLSRIEGVEIGQYSPGPSRPQMLILDFKIDRKIPSEKSEVFVLNLKLLKREYP